MTKITEIQHRGGTVAWSPIASHPDLLALGAKDSGGIGFDDHGGELDLYDLNMTSSDESAPALVGTIKTATRFASIGWTSSTSANYPLGIIAGGMIDGSVQLWDPRAILNGEEALLATIKQHGHGAVKALEFNKMEPHMLATGGSEGQVVIVDLSNPKQPLTSFPSGEPSKGAEVTLVAWNSQVAHIVAAAGSDGLVTVWDLKSKRPWCALRADGSAISAMAWNPTEGLHLVTASVDDRNPILKLWDLRASTTTPLATMQGHSEGVLALAWCPHDDTLLLSCGKDNRTILWDLYTLRPIADIPNDDDHHHDHSATGGNSASDLYGGGGVRSSQQRRYDVQWSPLKRGVVATCSLDRKVQAHSVMGLATKCGRPPKWLKSGSGVSCGFGGSLVSFSSTDKTVKIGAVVEQPALVRASAIFEAEIASMNVVDYCRARAAATKDAHEAQMWGFMQVLFEANGRAELVEHLGFHKDDIVKAAYDFVDEPSSAVAGMSLHDRPSKMTKGAEEAIKNALLVGDFAAAVECCLRTGNMADALVLASCAGGDVWTRTQERYFQTEAPHKRFLGFMGAIVANELEDLVANSDTANWKETLAIASTYGQSGEFPALSVALGERLEAAGDSRSASLCYMCSISLDRTVKFWQSQLEAANKKKGSTDLLAIHEFVVKVSVFLKAMDPSTVLALEIASVFAEYSVLLAEQGLLVTAAKYSKGDSESSKLLRDRLYRSRDSGYCLAALGSPPEFPFLMMNINRAPADFNPANPARSVQPQHPQQQAAATNSYTAMAQQPIAHQAPVADQLAAGWIALQDPSSGRTYYANQTTGQTSWEMPIAAPAPAPAPAPVPQQPVAHSQPQFQKTQPAVIVPQQPVAYSQPQFEQTQPVPVQPQQAATNGATTSTPSKLASKYGDGFVTSASHPALAQQYGNVGTSNPYTGAERPGTAAAVLAQSGSARAPVSGTFDPSKLTDLSPELQPIKDGLLELVSLLNTYPLGPADKKQMAEGEKGIAILLKRLALGDIDPEVASKMAAIVAALRSGDFASAAAIQTGLVSTDWRDNKDWLKGIKNVIQLTTKKIR